jgi:hypothetical protein
MMAALWVFVEKGVGAQTQRRSSCTRKIIQSLRASLFCQCVADEKGLKGMSAPDIDNEIQ